MVRIEDLLVFSIRTRMRSDHLAPQHHVEAVAVGLDGDVLESRRTRHAVAVVVETHHLVLVGLGGLNDTRIEAPLGEWQGVVTLAGEALANRLRLARLDAFPVAQAARAQVRVQRGKIVDLGHGRGPVPLQVANTTFDVRLLLRLANHAEVRLESVVTDQGLIAVVELPLPTDEQMRHHGLGIVPPQLLRHATKERERLDQALQDRLGAFGRQGQRERAIGIGPRRQQHGNEPSAVGKIDVDVAEVGFEPLSGIVVERDERRALGPSLGQKILPDALVAAGVAVFVAQPPKHLGDRVPLLAGSVFVRAHDLIEDRLKGIDHRRHRPALVLLGLGLGENGANLPPRMMELACQLANAQLVNAVRLSNARVLVHLDHPPPPVVWFPAGRASR